MPFFDDLAAEAYRHGRTEGLLDEAKSALEQIATSRFVRSARDARQIATRTLAIIKRLEAKNLETTNATRI